MMPDTLARLVSAVPSEESPYFGHTGHQLALLDIAQEIRRLVPIAAEIATDDECVRRRELVDAVLAALGPTESRAWYTVVCEDTPGEKVPVFGGVWANSFEEAIIEVVLWRQEFDGRQIVSADPDENGAHHFALNSAKRQLELDEAKRQRKADAMKSELTLFDFEDV